MAEHRFVLSTQVSALLGVESADRLERLVAQGLVRPGPRFHGRPPAYLITRPGLAAIGSRLPVPRPNLAQYDHDVGMAWLWLAARNGRFGEARAVMGERALRSRDMVPGKTHHPVGVRLGGVGAGGRPRLHYPDLLVVRAGGRRIAIELEQSSKGAARRERILGGYAADGRIDAVMYLVSDRRVGRLVAATVRALGIAELVSVLPSRLPESVPGRRSQAAPPGRGGGRRDARPPHDSGLEAAP